MFKNFDCLADQLSNGHEIPDKLGQRSRDNFDFRKLSSWTIIFLAGWLGFQGPPRTPYSHNGLPCSEGARPVSNFKPVAYEMHLQWIIKWCEEIIPKYSWKFISDLWYNVLPFETFSVRLRPPPPELLNCVSAETKGASLFNESMLRVDGWLGVAGSCLRRSALTGGRDESEDLNQVWPQTQKKTQSFLFHYQRLVMYQKDIWLHPVFFCSCNNPMHPLVV